MAIESMSNREVRFDFNGRYALVTGAAGGIGGAVADLLVRSGCRVAMADINVDVLKRSAGRIDPGGSRTLAIAYDARSPTAGDELVNTVLERFGTLDFLIPAAGVYLEQRFQDISENEWQQVMDINLDAVFRISRAAARSMTHGAAIVQIASIAGHRGSFHHAHYAASKGALLALSRSMARDLAPNVRVNCVSPGVTETAMVRDLVQNGGARLIADTPLGRFADPAEIAYAVAFLCSSASSFITGENIHVNGGLLMD